MRTNLGYQRRRHKIDKIKILALSQVFYPDRMGTGKVLSQLFWGLPSYKFDVQVVAAWRLYYDDDGTILPPYEKIDNVEIYRVLKIILSKERAYGRLFNYIAFFLLCSFKVLLAGLNKHKHIIFSVSNPPIMPLLGAFLKNKNNKFIYLVHDLYPDIAIRLGVVGVDNLMSKVMFAVNRRVFRKADKIIVLGRDTKQYLEKNYGVEASKIVVIPNWSADHQIKRGEVQKPFRLVYTGNIGSAHNLETAIKVAHLMDDELKLVFVGEGTRKQELMRQADFLGLQNVEFSPYLSDDDYIRMLESADALLLSLEKGLSGLAIPSKFYSYLSASKPVVAIAELDSEVALAIKEDHLGVVVAHDDCNHFVEAIATMIHDPILYKEICENVRQTFQSKYERSKVIATYEQLFIDLVNGVDEGGRA